MSKLFGDTFIKPHPRREFLKFGGSALATSAMALPKHTAAAINLPKHKQCAAVVAANGRSS